MTAKVLVNAEAISVERGGRKILHQADLTLHRGEILTLIGPNGAGKTTLVRVVLGLLKPDQGKVTRPPGLKIGYMPQKLHIEPSLPLTVERFLALVGSGRNEITTALEKVGIGHLQSNSMQLLSGGETQRVLLARALLRKPQLLVLDEPVQGVDVSGQAEFYRIISQVRGQLQCGVLMVSHDLHLVMAATDTVICLNQHVCCQGHPENVSHHPAYLELFGETAQPGIALYTHHHDHAHDMHGRILEQENDHTHA